MARKIEDLIMDDFTVSPEDNLFGVEQVDVNTNLKDVLGEALVAGLKAGKLTPQDISKLEDRLKLSLGFKFDNNYSLQFDTNTTMGRSNPVDARIKLTKGL